MSYDSGSYKDSSHDMVGEMSSDLDESDSDSDISDQCPNFSLESKNRGEDPNRVMSKRKGKDNCYSPSEDLRRKSVESRSSYDDYSPQPKRIRGDATSKSSSGCKSRLKGDSGSYSRDMYVPESKSSKLDKTSKNRKRENDESSSSSSDSQESCPQTKKASISDYSLPSGTSLNKPLEGGIGAKIMSKMGYKSGKGLGKYGEGRVDPVGLSKQKGRQGLGLTIENLDEACDHWDPSLEKIEIPENYEWLVCSNNELPDIYELENWMEEGPRNLNISKMTEFCEPHLLASVLSCKSVFDKMQDKDMLNARSRSNPFETIRKSIFQNRAAVKMANMDAKFDFMFTKPTYRNGEPMVGENGLLYFADVCAGPGGFSEYVLWRKKWRAKGIGFTLKGENDFKLGDFKSGPPETFKPYYGSKGDGNVFDSDNIIDLTNVVMKATSNKGVHFMMADGGFSVEGQENIQELLSKQLYLCQFLVALSIVRNEGHFVCKLFDLFSPFSVGLVYLMYRCFAKICIFKPNTSRPANSERYIICKWKRSDTEEVRDYLFRINERLNELGSNSSDDVNYCVPMDVLQDDSTFYDYIITSNNKLGEKQIINLAKISAYYRDNSLIESRQSTIRKECLTLWELPDKIIRKDSQSTDDVLKTLFKRPQQDSEFLQKSLPALKEKDIKSKLGNFYNWKFNVLGNEDHEVTYFLGLGRNNVMRYQFNRKKWDVVPHSSFELSPGTLVLGEVVMEEQSVHKSRKTMVLHIFDAYSLGYEIISNWAFGERLKMCRLYVEALSNINNPDTKTLRVMTPFEFSDLGSMFCSLAERSYKLCLKLEDSFFPAKGILFFNTTKGCWERRFSSNSKMFYYHNPELRRKETCMPAEAIGSFRDCVEKTLVWQWEVGVGLRNEGRRDNVIHKDDLLNLITADREEPPNRTK